MTEAQPLTSDEFRPILEMEFGYLLGTLRREGSLRGDAMTRRARFTRVGVASAEFGAFLDDHGARKNRAYSYLAELAGSLRGLCGVGREVAQLEWIVGREVCSEAWSAKLGAESRATSSFLVTASTRLIEALLAEGQRLLGGGAPEIEEFDDPERTPRRLVEDLETITLPEVERRVLEIASRLLGCQETLKRESDGGRFDDPEEMKRFVLEVADEQEVRFFETRIHNLLSRYDTYVQGTSVEEEDAELPRLRRHLQVLQHLLRAMNELVHFYERHENDIRCEVAKDRIATLVDKATVLDRILNFALVQLHVVIDAAAGLADGLIQRYGAPGTTTLEVPDGVELHARPVSLITRVVNHHGTAVYLQVGEERCYAGSMLEVLMALGSHPDARSIAFEGDDKPLRDLKLLFEHGLGEQDKALPPELNYLGQ